MVRIVSEHVKLPDPVLPRADWADRYSRKDLPAGTRALQIAERLVGEPPSWVVALLGLRNRIVAMFGLKPAEFRLGAFGDFGAFPVVSSKDSRVVLGFDDSHLDFRIVIDVHDDSVGTARVTLTTLVARHNAMGRIYILLVTPFHKLIVRTFLRRLSA